MQQLLDGRYEILKPLSSGGFGKTYLARDMRIPGTPACVVKQLHCTSHDPQDIQLAQQLFQREAESLAKLGHHDQIPRLLAYFTENEEFFLVEDYIEGRSLEEEIQAGQPWPEIAVIELIRGILDVLAYVHSQGVIHRDIKPGNLIRRQSDGKIVLIDFGAIKQLEQAHPHQAHRTGTQIGTAGYMPPEQAQGKPRPNSDLYGIGIVAISALTGHPALGLPDDPQTGEIVWQHLAPASPGLAQILDRLVRYHFQHRYQTVQDVQQDLQALTNGVAAAAATPPASTADGSATQVATPVNNHLSSLTGTAESTSPTRAKGAPWVLGIGLAIVIPILGGAASLIFNSGISSSKSSPTSTSEIAQNKPCTARVNGNIRSERTSYFGSQNILQTGQGQNFEIGTRETRGGWLEIKLPSGQLAWTHLDIVANESQLKSCLQQKDIALQTISDIPPPARPTPQTVQTSPPNRPNSSPERPENTEVEDANEDETQTGEDSSPSATPSNSSDSPATETPESATDETPTVEESTPSIQENEAIERSAPGTVTPPIEDDSSEANDVNPNNPGSSAE